MPDATLPFVPEFDETRDAPAARAPACFGSYVGLGPNEEVLGRYAA